MEDVEMTSDEQPRRTSGQWDVKPQSDPEVVLAENVDGSFLFPPNHWPGGAQEYLHFWKTQPISDEALTNLASSYAAEWDEWAEPIVREWLETWGNGEEARQLRRKFVNNTPALVEARLRKVDEFEANLEATRPKRIPTSLVRHVARAAQIVHNLPALRVPEHRQVATQEVIYHNQKGEPWTAGMIWDSYRLKDIMPDAFLSRENAVLRELRAQMYRS